MFFCYKTSCATFLIDFSANYFVRKLNLIKELGNRSAGWIMWVSCVAAACGLAVKGAVSKTHVNMFVELHVVRWGGVFSTIWYCYEFVCFPGFGFRPTLQTAFIPWGSEVVYRTELGLQTSSIPVRRPASGRSRLSLAFLSPVMLIHASSCDSPRASLFFFTRSFTAACTNGQHY